MDEFPGKIELDPTIFSKLPHDIIFSVILPLVPREFNQLNKQCHAISRFTAVDRYIEWVFRFGYSSNNQFILPPEDAYWKMSESLMRGHYSSVRSGAVNEKVRESLSFIGIWKEYNELRMNSIDETYANGKEYYLRLQNLVSLIIYTVFKRDDALFKHITEMNDYARNFMLHGMICRTIKPDSSLQFVKQSSYYIRPKDCVQYDINDPEDHEGINRYLRYDTKFYFTRFGMSRALLANIIILYGTNDMVSFVIKNMSALGISHNEILKLYTTSDNFKIEIVKEIVRDFVKNEGPTRDIASSIVILTGLLKYIKWDHSVKNFAHNMPLPIEGVEKEELEEEEDEIGKASYKSIHNDDDEKMLDYVTSIVWNITMSHLTMDSIMSNHLLKDIWNELFIGKLSNRLGRCTKNILSCKEYVDRIGEILSHPYWAHAIYTEDMTVSDEKLKEIESL